MLTAAGWKDFEETQGWREVVDTVKARMALVNQDLLSPEVCNSNEKRIQLQQEYLTCLWFINLPKYDIAGGKDEEVGAAPSDLPAAK